MATQLIDQEKAEAFVGKAMGDFAGATATVLSVLGDRLGLFKALALGGPATSAELAQRASIDERYAREWLAGMAAAGYLEHKAGSFTLPLEHQGLLTDEDGPMFFGGFYECFAAEIGALDRLTDAFRSGGGVPQSAYSDDMWNGMERMTASWFDHQLVPVWLAAMPEVEAALRAGADVADVGCGRGRALIKLAQTHPSSRYVGFDAFAPSVAKANANAATAGVGSQVRFEHADVSEALPGSYDVIFTFDVVHDAADPAGLLANIRNALRPDGAYVCVDVNCAPTVDGNAGPVGTLFYGVSILYCMTTSLAQGGAGLGTCGFHEAKVTEMSLDAGFSYVQKLDVENPFNNVYLIRP